MSYFRVNENCNGCLACVENCPAVALAADDRDGQRILRHNMAKCARCGQCWRVCPQQAIEFEHLMIAAWDEVVRLDLICCQVCGEPLYSPAFREKVAGKLRTSQEISQQALCQKHRRRYAGAMWPGSGSGSPAQAPGDNNT